MFFSKSNEEKALALIRKHPDVLSAHIVNGVIMTTLTYEQSSFRLNGIDWSRSFIIDGGIQVAMKTGEKNVFTDNSGQTNWHTAGIPCQIGKEQELLDLLKSL